MQYISLAQIVEMCSNFYCKNKLHGYETSTTRSIWQWIVIRYDLFTADVA